MMGIKLMKNFDHPYSATGIKEFWARWHISLSGWFKDYLYIPLGGNRCSKPRAAFNVFVVFLVSGLWHGANWTFVIWGAIHGLYQVVGTLTRSYRDRIYEKAVVGVRSKFSTVKAARGVSESDTSCPQKTVDRTGAEAPSVENSPLKSMPVVLWRRLLTFLLVSFAWIFFRSNSISDSLIILDKLFVSGWNTGIGEALAAMDMSIVGVLTTVLSLVILFIIDRLLVYDGVGDRSEKLTRGGAFIYFVWIIALCWMLLLSKDVVSTFIYFQF